MNTRILGLEHARDLAGRREASFVTDGAAFDVKVDALRVELRLVENVC